MLSFLNCPHARIVSLPLQTAKLRTVLLLDEATQTSNTEDFRVSRLTREADALRKELDSLADELAKRDAADAKVKAVAAQEREERERVAEAGAEKRVELEKLVSKLTKEGEEKREAWAKKENELQGTLLEAERRAEVRLTSAAPGMRGPFDGGGCLGTVVAVLGAEKGVGLRPATAFGSLRGLSVARILSGCETI